MSRSRSGRVSASQIARTMPGRILGKSAAKIRVRADGESGPRNDCGKYYKEAR
jgi:hypothetical protein